MRTTTLGTLVAFLIIWRREISRRKIGYASKQRFVTKHVPRANPPQPVFLVVFSLLFPRVDSSAPGNGGVAPCKTGGWRQTCHQCVDLTIEYLLLEQKHTPKMQSSGLIPVECLVSNQKCSGLPKNARPLPGIQATWPASFFCRKFDAPALSRGHCTAGCGFMARTGSRARACRSAVPTRGIPVRCACLWRGPARVRPGT